MDLLDESIHIVMTHAMNSRELRIVCKQRFVGISNLQAIPEAML